MNDVVAKLAAMVFNGCHVLWFAISEYDENFKLATFFVTKIRINGGFRDE